MAGTPSWDALRARAEQHGGAGALGEGEAALANALEAIGWRAAGADAVETVAAEGWLVVQACVDGHRDPARAARDLAELMHRHAPRHSDFLAPVEDFVPAAAEVLRLYAAGARHERFVPPPL
jgi:hypothetical protein